MKFNTTIKVLLALMVLAMVAGTALAADKPVEKTKKVENTKKVEDTKKMDGKELFKTQCKVCHLEDSDAGEYTPMSLIMDQWDEFYDTTFEETHKDVTSLQDKDKMVTDVITKDMIKKMRKFCIDHAADSESPMTCG